MTQAGSAARSKPKGPPRGRPTLSRVAEIDRTLIATARALFLENGYANTSMEAVAAAAGVAKGTLYARYPAKPDLFRAIVADRLAAWAAIVGVTASDAGDLDALLLHNGRSFFTAMANPEIAAFDHLILAEAGRFPELAEEFHLQGYLAGVNDLAAAITQTVGTSGPVGDAFGVARTFTAALLGWWRNEAVRGSPPPEECEQFLRRTVDLLLHGRSAW